MSHLFQYLESFFPDALEAVGRGSGLEGAAAVYLCAVFLDDTGDGERLLFAFHGAGSGHDNGLAAPDFNIADGDNSRFGGGLAADELIGPGDGDGFLDTFQRQQLGGVDGSFIAEDADGGAYGAGHGHAAVAHFLDLFNT